MSVDEKRWLQVARETVTALAGIVRALALYDVNNATVRRLVEQLLTAVSDSGPEGVRIQLLTEEFFVNGRLLRVDPQLYERCTALSATLCKLGVGEIFLGSGLQQADVDALCIRLSPAVRGRVAEVSFDSIGAIELGRVSAGGVAANRFEPDRLAVAAYAVLLDLTDRLYADAAAGRTPTLLPLKRAIQAVADGMEQYPAYYLLLAAIHDPAVPLARTRWRVATAVHAMGFAIAGVLGRDVVMTVALGALLGGLTESADPDAAAESLFQFTGLGEGAMPLALTLYDACTVRRGRPGGVLGQIVALAYAYVERTAGVAPGFAPARFVQAVAAGGIKVIDPDLAHAFTRWLGPHPVGSLVALPGGVVAVVLGWGEAGRLEVLRLGPGGEPGERGLLSSGASEVTGTPTYAEAGVDLTRW